MALFFLTHWGRATHICVSDLTSIGSDNDLSPGRRQAIIRTNAGILLIRPLGTNFSEFLVEILIFSFKKMHLKVSSAKRWPFCLGLNELNAKIFKIWLFKFLQNLVLSNWSVGKHLCQMSLKSTVALCTRWSLNPETSWCFDFKLEPAMCVTRQITQ